MKPTNAKSLFHFMCDQMEKLNDKQVDTEVVKQQVAITKQLTSMMRYELQRAKTQMEIRDFNLRTGAHIELRELEGKPFDNTI